MQIQSRALVSMISVCLSFFDDRTTIVKRLKGIAAGHFHKGVSSNQYWVLCQAVMDALMTCLGCSRENPSIAAWDKIFAYFLSVIVPYAKSLEVSRSLTNVFKNVCGDYESKRIANEMKRESPPSQLSSINVSRTPTVRYQNINGLEQTSLNQTSLSPTSTSACPYHDAKQKKYTYKPELFSLNTIDVEVTGGAQRDRVTVGAVVHGKDMDEGEEPLESCPIEFLENQG